jgi:uncharacterized membrane protein/protein-disulfide isomerase
MTRTVRLILLALALVGLASSLASLYVHVQLLAKPSYTSFCDVSATVSCTTVYQSTWSTFLGTPVALFGAGYYVAVVLLLLGSVRGPESLRENAIGHIFVLSTAGLGFSLFLAYTAFFVIKAVCLMCLVTYIAVAGLFILSGVRTPFRMTTWPRRLWQDVLAVLASPVWLTAVIVFILAAAGAVAFTPGHAVLTTPGAGTVAPQAPADRKAEFLKFWEAQKRVEIPVSADGAAVLIVRFSDYQCPSCGRTYLDYKPILAKYNAQFPGAIRVVTKDFPLETECNVGMSRDIHLAACEAAVAARLARQTGRGEAMESWLYTNGATLTPALVRKAAAEIGGVSDFDAQYAATLNQVKADVALAAILNIRVTPTFYFNGLRQEGGLPLDYFEMALQYELKRAGKIVN